MHGKKDKNKFGFKDNYSLGMRINLQILLLLCLFWSRLRIEWCTQQISTTPQTTDELHWVIFATKFLAHQKQAASQPTKKFASSNKIGLIPSHICVLYIKISVWFLKKLGYYSDVFFVSVFKHWLLTENNNRRYGRNTSCWHLCSATVIGLSIGGSLSSPGICKYKDLYLLNWP